MNVQITLEDDHSLYISIFEHSNLEKHEEARRYREEREAKRVGVPSYSLSNIVTVNLDPFYIEIHSYVANPETDVKTIYWSTRGTSFIFGQHYSMFSIVHPNT